MVASRFLLASLIICCFASAASAAEVRTWTDTNGKTLTGKFVAFVDDDKVRIETEDGKTFDISINRFSNTDKEYLDTQKESGSSSSNRPRRSNLMGWRQWTDAEGTEIKAKYKRMVDGDVILMQGNIGHRVNFYQLSEEDQAYLRAELTTRGEEGSIPPKPVTPSVGNESGGGNPIVGGGPSYTPPSITPPSNNNYEPNIMGNQAPSYAPPKSAEEIAAENAKVEEARRREEEKLAYAEQKKREKAEEDERRRQQQEQQVARNSGPSFPHSGPRPPSMPNFGSQQQEVMVYHCTKCNKQVPEDIGAGDHCPHCGAFFEYAENPNGSKTYASGYDSSTSASSFSRVRIPRIGKAIGGVLFLLGLIYAGFRKLTGN
ncbi:SHD1 domain-containing protein [Blastopirellula marina]|uniref:SLA1 homology domain-containing protein n=1 Tax=Blastopirellula marina TaxID=124 RepID=A0A2S8GDT4_9BACT|nr:SHD1 domain-containing protein [Blastopirellula marina]PQO42622.1 hypothetical protein C5Y98_01940 [Blastopirellula marina]PTL46388.1 hypothetical protein C5Y97_01940 [Blastopirellula marina]